MIPLPRAKSAAGNPIKESQQGSGLFNLLIIHRRTAELEHDVGKGQVGLVWQIVIRLLRHKMMMLFIGGGLGTLARYYLSHWISSHVWAQEFPYGTLIVNVSGCFVLGVIGGLLLEPALAAENEQWYLLCGTGFCGGYTTFSTFAWETSKQMRLGSGPLALANVLASVVFGILGVFLALFLVNVVFGKR
jgi:CrcB protein